MQSENSLSVADSQLLACTLKPVYSLPCYFFKIRFKIIFPLSGGRSIGVVRLRTSLISQVRG
jgi:hypothetical protein